MRSADALSLARTLMASGAREQDRHAVAPRIEWRDDTTPRTSDPVRFRHGMRYVRGFFGTLEAVVPFSRIA